MKVAICISNVPDTTTKIRFTDGNSKFDSSGVQWIINPWDELALTRALELKEDPASGIDQVTVIHVGQNTSEPTIRKALAIGADDAIRVDAEPSDGFHIASQLAGVVKEGYDLILCGIESSDYNESSVGGMVSELVGMTSVSAVSGLEISGGKVTVNRDIDGGTEEIAVPTPSVLVVQKGIAKEPRIPSMRGIMMAKKKPLQVVQAVEASPLTEFVGYEMPPQKAACKLVDPEQVDELVELLHNEAKVI
jgi:electron transfer flavoprotein beta subunit